MSIAIPSSLMLSSLAENDSGVSTAVRNAQAVNSQSELAAIVRLTEAEQAQRLYIQGHTVPQIAFSLSLSQQAVDSYLNISNAKG
jgi:DNA-binding NarL/FixJ family response regulator